jgi:molybdate transport system substrate-binding protein
VDRKHKPAMVVASSILAAVAVAAFLLAQRTPAQTKELRVFISDGMKPVVEELTPQIEKAIGRKLAAQFNSSKNLRDKIQNGESFDAAILTADILDDLIKQGKIAPASRVELARTGMGVGVRAGAAKPDISTPDALKQALLNAKFISFNPTGASAPHTYAMIDHLGITHELKPKLMLDAEAGRPQKNVVDGKADVVISLIPEIKFFPGVELVGPVPAEFQSYVNFAAGIAANTQDADAGKALIQFIGGPAAAQVIKAKGMEPR